MLTPRISGPAHRVHWIAPLYGCRLTVLLALLLHAPRSPIQVLLRAVLPHRVQWLIAQLTRLDFTAGEVAVPVRGGEHAVATKPESHRNRTSNKLISPGPYSGK